MRLRAMYFTGKNRGGFTLLEILLAVTILGVISMVTFMTFSTAVNAWQKGTKVADSLNHGDFVMDQLVMGLRSAYYPESHTKGYGFSHKDDGDGDDARDEISWVKLGGALVGRDSKIAETPHRVKFFITEDDDGNSVAAVKYWRLQGQMEDFDPEELEPVVLSKEIVGFNCRMAYELDENDEIDWLDEWEDDLTNKIPTVVEVTLYLQPPDKDDEPIEMKRVVGLRLGALAWGNGGSVPPRGTKNPKPPKKTRGGSNARGGQRVPVPPRGGVPGGTKFQPPPGARESGK